MERMLNQPAVHAGATDKESNVMSRQEKTQLAVFALMATVVALMLNYLLMKP